MSDQQPVFNIEKIYVKDASLEAPHAPQIFLEPAQPQVEVQLATAATRAGDGLYESVLTITVTAKAGDKTCFLVEVAQAGIFQIRNLGTEDMEVVMGVGCPNILYPYLREVVSDAATRAAPTDEWPLGARKMDRFQAFWASPGTVEGS